ncbi:DUF86 domain-containing protein [Candidatus Woesearchaeota archaeon]|nr:DUF86 domain-containing protein [Candidatus Woesearchaeota archaeon]
MEKDPKIFLDHILKSIEIIEGTIKNKSKEEFFKQRDLQDICIYRIQIIGEAAKNISKKFQQEHKDIPWKEMAGTRDKLIHDYFGVDFEICWVIIKKELPKIKKGLKEIL